jgi:tetratricopeptide (TPR) repeat protein
MDGMESGSRRVLVGREQVLDTLRLAIDDAVAGRGGLTLLSGEPGVGKTRLAEEACDFARSREATVAWGSCWEGEGAPGFWPWLQILRVVAPGGDGGSLLGRTGDTLSGTTKMRQAPLVEVGQERFRLFDTITGMLSTACRDRPLVAVLDDLHWSDAPSLRLLRFLAQSLRSSPMLVLGTYRDVEVGADHPLAEVLGELTWCRHLPLRGLPRPAVARLVAEASGVELTEDAAETLRAATDGNPFFVREIAAFLSGADCLSAPGLTPADITVPGGVAAVVRRRVDRLTGSCVELLEAAAVLGQEFDLDVLSVVLGQPEATTSEQADEAVRTRLLTTVPGTPARLRFVHALVRQTLYSGLAPTRQSELHARAAEAIVLRHRHDLTPPHAEVAHHLWEAGTDPAQTVDYTVEAGHAAMHALAYEDAVSHFSRAVKILEGNVPGSAVRQCDVLLLLADAQLAAGNTTAVRGTIKTAALLAQRTDTPDRLARAALTAGTVDAFTILDDLEVDLLQAALKALPETETKLRARVLARLAKAWVLNSELERRTRLADEAVAMARRAGDPEVLGWVLLDRQVAVWGFAPPPERLGIATKIVGLAEEIGDANLLVCGHILRIANLLELGEVAGYSAGIHVFDQLVRQHRMTELRWQVPLLRATEAHIAGRPAEAERLAEEGLAMGRRVNQPGIEVWYLVAGFFGKYWQGRGEESEPLVRRLIEEMPHIPALRTCLATIQVQTGRTGEAAIELERQAADRFARLPRDFTWLINVAGLALICHCTDDRSRAEILYDLLLPHAPYLLRVNQLGVGCSGPVAYFLGLLATTLNRADEAVQQFEAAVAINERIGAPVFAAQARAKLAESLEARGRNDDRNRAEDLRAQADTAMRTLDIRPLIPPTATRRGPRSAVLHREGDYWTIQHAASPVRLRDRVGIRYLARLLTEPGREFHVLDLAAAPDADQRLQSTNLGPVLDETAKTAYRRRLAELTEDLQEAEAFGDQGRTEAAHREIEALTDQLTAAVGLGGRDRRPGSDAERARTAVTKAIKSAITTIATHDPVLGGHLRQAVSTGTYCSYTSDPTAPLHWSF